MPPVLRKRNDKSKIIKIEEHSSQGLLFQSLLLQLRILNVIDFLYYLQLIRPLPSTYH